jgi:transposase InsO family protein
MISTQDRRDALELIEEARRAGARLAPACRELGLTARTYQRWTRKEAPGEDRRRTSCRPVPPHTLSAEEREQVIEVCNQQEHASLPPGQIVPKLADEGVYLASESTFYRILKAEAQVRHRGRTKTPRAPRPPSTHTATGPRQVFCWDITWLPGPVRGKFYYLYLIMDLYSRKIVGWEVHERERAVHASALIERTRLAERCIDQPLVLHGDNGSPLKASSVQVTLKRLGIVPSYSRPRVSDDNAFVESLFRTCKYVPTYPKKGFADLTSARHWVAMFVRWYNHEHRHSGIRFVTPEERHQGLDHDILARRQALYEAKQAEHPRRWSGKVRNWEPIGVVHLNPERDTQLNSSVAA